MERSGHVKENPVTFKKYQWNKWEMGDWNSQQTANCAQRKTSENEEITWFPTSKEELLDYCAAYIQMMIMGAEMVKNQSAIRIEY